MPIYAKMGPYKGYNYKWHMEAPNGEGTFNNVEEGPKIITFTDYIILKNRLLMGQK